MRLWGSGGRRRLIVASPVPRLLLDWRRGLIRGRTWHRLGCWPRRRWRRILIACLLAGGRRKMRRTLKLRLSVRCRGFRPRRDRRRRAVPGVVMLTHSALRPALDVKTHSKSGDLGVER